MAKPSLWPIIALAAAGLAPSAHAQTIVDTICSDPSRETIYEKLAFRLPPGGETILRADLERFARQAGLSPGGVGMDDPHDPAAHSYEVILQSPQVSVGIIVMMAARSPDAYAYVARSCITDALEPWEPYWARFRAFVAAQNYAPVPWDPAIRCRGSFCALPSPRRPDR
jgi:hypothetical protein